MIKPPDFDPARSTRSSVTPIAVRTPHRCATPGVAGAICGINCSRRRATSSGFATTVRPVARALNLRGRFKQLGVPELHDLEDGVAWLKQQPWVDGARIGINGWSYGGFMTAYALTHSTAFKMGIAGAPVTDWRLYDSIYTERYMGTPQNNPEGYEQTSVVKAAKNLSGKLLLIHGAIDDNVHMQNSIQFIYELEKAGKQFSFMVYPRSRHGVADPLLVRHMREMMLKFILENL